MTELGQIDSRRSLSEILNEGDIAHIDNEQEELTINSKVQNRLHGNKASLHHQKIETIAEDDKENNLSSIMQGYSDKK